MESPQANTSASQTPGTAKSKAGKLKTYAKRGGSASKPMRSSARIRAASEDLIEQQTPARPSIPQTIDETPVQAKAARKTRKRKADAAAAAASPTDEAMAEAAVEQVAEQPAKTRKRRSKKQSDIQPEEEQEVEVPETQDEPSEEQPEEQPEDHPAEPEEPRDDVIEDEAEAEAGAVDAEPEEPEDATENDISQFEVPPDSDNEEQQAQSSSAKPKTKRKRQSTENGSPAPSVKRVKRASMPRGAAGDYPEQGPFTPVECDLIEQHLVEFMRDNSKTRDELVAMIQNSSREMSKIYVDLATDVLPHRNRRAVQRYCRRHYNNFQRGRWTDEQDELLRTAYAENPNKWVKIGERVGRMPEDCRDRWRNHVSLDQRHTDVWTQDEEHRLATAVRDCLRSVEANMEAKLDRSVEDDYIAWGVVVNKMNGSRNRLQCSMKWRKIKQRVIREEAAQREREAAIERGEIEPDNEEFDDGMTSPHTTTRWKAEAARRFDEMTVGDMLDVTRETLYGAQMGAFASKNTFWAVVTRLHAGSPWTTADRKMVYKRLKANVPDLQDFRGNLEAQVEWLEASFEPGALAERTAPKHRASHGGRRSNGGVFRSEEKVQESDEEGDLTMPSVGVEQQIDEEMADAVGGGDVDAEDGDAENQEQEEVELNGNGNGYAEEEVPQSPHVSESEHDEADYN